MRSYLILLASISLMISGCNGTQIMSSTVTLEQLPKDLHYLITPARQYGVHQFDDDISHFLDQANHDDMACLIALADRVKLHNDYPRVLSWINRYDDPNEIDVQKLYFLFLVMDMAGLSFEPR